MRSLAGSLLIVAVVTIGIWFVAGQLGYDMSLLFSLAMSVGLTLLLNLGSLRRRRLVRDDRPRGPWGW